MQNGEHLLKSLGLLFLAFVFWGLADLLSWLTGKTTASQIVIKHSKKNKKYAYAALAFSILVAFVGIWLIFHWESPCILFNIYC